MSRLEDRLKQLKDSLKIAQLDESNEAVAEGESIPNHEENEETTERIEEENVETNPHKMYKEIIKNPTPKGVLVMNLRGRPIDVHDLENYLIFKISPKTITTIMRYSDSKTIAEALNLSRTRRTSTSKNVTTIITLLIILVAVGLFLAFGGMNKILTLFHFVH